LPFLEEHFRYSSEIIGRTRSGKTGQVSAIS
jgi:hypothetical protein